MTKISSIETKGIESWNKQVAQKVMIAHLRASKKSHQNILNSFQVREQLYFQGKVTPMSAVCQSECAQNQIPCKLLCKSGSGGGRGGGVVVNAMLGVGGDVGYGGCEPRIEGIVQCTKRYCTILRKLKKVGGGGGGGGGGRGKRYCTILRKLKKVGGGGGGRGNI